MHFITSTATLCEIVSFVSLQKKYMNYQTFLSAILESKYYTEQEIRQLTWTLQRNSGLRILSSRQTSGQILLYCSNREFQACCFQHLFRKTHEVKGLEKFELVSSHEKHSTECENQRTGKISQEKSENDFYPSKSTISMQSVDIHPSLTNKQSISQTFTGTPASKQPIINQVKMDSEKSISMEKKVYTEDQFTLLKKELELISKGLLSRSTEFQSQQSVNGIKRIQFHCKFDPQCPYEASLTLQESEQKPTTLRKYSLEVLNPNHLPQCILDDQIINYNQNTMKIDKQMDVLTKIIQQNSHELKPKDILKKLSQTLGEDEEFIYNGLQKKINRRAIKKYFDNCVAKVRSKVFPHLKTERVQSPTKIKNSKKDEDYYWK